MWRVCKEAGRPWPVLCPDDDVLDYMIMEAVAIKADKDEEKARKDAERREWKKQEAERLKKQFN